MLPLLLAIPFLAAASFLFLPRRRMKASAPWLITMMATAGCLVLLGYATFNPWEEGTRRFFAEWMPQIGLNFSLWLDGPALLFSWIVAGIGFLIFFYAGYYLDPKDSPWRFFGTMLLFMGSMLGVVMSRNALLMFLFWEMTSLTSFILIGHWHEKDSARAGAVRALITTGLGGLCLMAGIAGWFFLLTSNGVDGAMALEWDILWKNREILAGGGVGALACFFLVLLGAFTKSAQFPFHYWLPGAMEAPTPVSAFLHAATMVKAGIYLLGRIYPIYWDYELWLPVVGGIGVVTILVGGFMAITSRDLKQLLAHSTVSQLGLLTAYYGFGYGLVHAEKMLPLDLLLVASHALFKGALFMLVGVIDHGTHTRDWTRLGGLFKQMPVTAILTIIGCASMAGVPFTLGFVAKELFLKMSIHLHTDDMILKYALPAIAIFGSLFTVAYCIRMAVSPFFGKLRDTSIHPHEGSFGLLAPPALMIAICLIGGIYVPLVEGPIASMVNGEFYGLKSGFHVAMFHHVDILLGIAAFLFGVGTLVFLAGRKIDASYISLGSPSPFADSYHWAFDKAIPSLAAALARTVQSPSLSRNAMLTVLVMIILVGGAMLKTGFLPSISYEQSGAQLMAISLIILTLPCLYIVLTHKVMLVRVIAMSPIGLFVAMYFLIFKAPDLALTQIMVELVVLIVLLLVIIQLPQRIQRPAKGEGGPKLMRAGIAIVAGTMFGLFSYAAMTNDMRDQATFPNVENYPSVKEYYIENTKHAAYEKEEKEEAKAAGYPGADSLRSGGGSNAVNVILVDFRGTDTMGEISVLGLAALGVMILLGMGRGPKDPGHPTREELRSAAEHINYSEEPEPPGRQVLSTPTWPTPSLILTEIGRVVPAYIILLAMVIFWAGHNAPGGGFIAGLLVSGAAAVLFLAFKKRAIEVLHRMDYLVLIPIGLAFAVGTGLVAVALGMPFLTSGYTYIHFPVIGEIEVASAMGFDLGVFLVVVGVTMLILERLGRE